MGWQGNFQTNIDCQSGVGGDTGRCLFNLFKALAAAQGWTVVQSGDGISVNPSGDIFTGCSGDFAAGPSASDWSGAGCWVVLRMTGTTLEIAIWRSTTTNYNQQGTFQIKISPTGFDDNTLRAANHPPDSADQESILGTLPGGFATFCDYNYDLYSHIGCDDLARNGIYRFYAVTKRQTDNLIRSFFYFDTGDHGVDGDPQPWVIFHRYASSGGAAVRAVLESATTGPKGYRDYGGGTEQWSVYECKSIGDDPSSPGDMSQQVDGNVIGIPLPYYSVSAAAWKGVSRSFFWNPISARGYPDRDAPSSSADEEPTDDQYSGPALYVDDLIVPWEKDTTPL